MDIDISNKQQEGKERRYTFDRNNCMSACKEGVDDMGVSTESHRRTGWYCTRLDSCFIMHIHTNFVIDTYKWLKYYKKNL